MTSRSIRVGVLVFISIIRASASASAAVVVETVPVGDPGNASPSFTIVGSVAYTYNIGKYEVTAAQYTAFLNAVAKNDTVQLYSPLQGPGNPFGCGISRTGTQGNYSYTVSPGYANRPVNYVAARSATRFANWLHNGQPTGPIGPATTEDGAYAYRSDGNFNPRKSDWKWAIPNWDEWYKAAFYKGGGTNAGYWRYATQSDQQPGADLTDQTGNNANYLINGKGPQEPLPIDSPYYTTIVGQFRNSESHYGTYDQGGNVSEWVDNIFNPITNPQPLFGGNWFSGPFQISNMAFPSSGESTFGIQAHFGFRVVQMPAPSTGLILAAAAGWAGTRRRQR